MFASFGLGFGNDNTNDDTIASEAAAATKARVNNVVSCHRQQASEEGSDAGDGEPAGSEARKDGAVVATVNTSDVRHGDSRRGDDHHGSTAAAAAAQRDWISGTGAHMGGGANAGVEISNAHAETAAMERCHSHSSMKAAAAAGGGATAKHRVATHAVEKKLKPATGTSQRKTAQKSRQNGAGTGMCGAARPSATGGSGTRPASAAGEPRSCTRCGTTRTPLWRNGPDGPKTLCNACGVRDNRLANKRNGGGTKKDAGGLASGKIMKPKKASNTRATGGASKKRPGARPGRADKSGRGDGDLGRGARFRTARMNTPGRFRCDEFEIPSSPARMLKGLGVRRKRTKRVATPRLFSRAITDDFEYIVVLKGDSDKNKDQDNVKSEFEDSATGVANDSSGNDCSSGSKVQQTSAMGKDQGSPSGGGFDQLGKRCEPIPIPNVRVVEGYDELLCDSEPFRLPDSYIRCPTHDALVKPGGPHYEITDDDRRWLGSLNETLAKLKGAAAAPNGGDGCWWSVSETQLERIFDVFEEGSATLGRKIDASAAAVLCQKRESGKPSPVVAAAVFSRWETRRRQLEEQGGRALSSAFFRHPPPSEYRPDNRKTSLWNICASDLAYGEIKRRKNAAAWNGGMRRQGRKPGRKHTRRPVRRNGAPSRVPKTCSMNGSPLGAGGAAYDAAKAYSTPSSSLANTPRVAQTCGANVINGAIDNRDVKWNAARKGMLSPRPVSLDITNVDDKIYFPELLSRSSCLQSHGADHSDDMSNLGNGVNGRDACLLEPLTGSAAGLTPPMVAGAPDADAPGRRDAVKSGALDAQFVDGAHGGSIDHGCGDLELMGFTDTWDAIGGDVMDVLGG